MIDDCPDVPAAKLAWISEADMVELDRVMIEDLHIELIQMMENAGRALARVVRSYAGADRIVVAAGSGGNGGGGLVAARHLANAGQDVAVVTTRPRSLMAPVPAHQLDILERMSVPVVATAIEADVLVDAVIGYSLRGAPRGQSAVLIEASQRAGAVVALDTPSGLDVTSGTAPGVVVRADATVTLALPKMGLRGSELVGDLYLADISVPPTVTGSFGMPAPSFGPSGLLRIVDDGGGRS
jgi:NAD(P)H-hydrate epimerase